MMRYYYNNARKDFDIGSYPLMSLKEARDENQRLRKKLEQGHDPKVIRQLERQAIIAAKSLKGLFDLWYDAYCVKNMPTVATTQDKIRLSFNSEIFSRIALLKKRHADEIQPLQDKKAELVRVQRAERRELSEQQRVKRHLLTKAGRDKFRRGVMGFFDKVTGREKRIRLINQKEMPA